MIHVEEIIRETIKALKKLRAEQKTTLHALIYGQWGVGKTVSAKKVLDREVFYVRGVDAETTKGRLLRLIGYSLGCGSRHTYEATKDLIRAHCEYLSLEPILLIDESQRFLKRTLILDELKDLSEELSFCYIFLGDQSVPKLLASYPHSLFKRIVIKKSLEGMTEKTVEELLNQFGVNADSKLILNFCKNRALTTIDLALILQAAKNSKREINEETLEKFALALGR